MEGATHFIECWYNPESGRTFANDIRPIERLQQNLRATKTLELATYAIIYIKAKNNHQ